MSVRVDISAVRACALLVWRGLTDAQRSALRRAITTWPGLSARGHGRALAALHGHGLVEQPTRPSRLSPLGMLVREVGLDADAAAAKRRYRRRKVKT